MTTSPPPLSQVLQQYRGAFLTVRPSDIARWAMLAGADEGPANLRLTDHPLVQAAVLRALADDADWLQEAHDPEAVRLRLLAWAENLSPTSVTSVPMTPPPPPPPFPGALS